MEPLLILQTEARSTKEALSRSQEQLRTQQQSIEALTADKTKLSASVSALQKVEAGAYLMQARLIIC